MFKIWRFSVFTFFWVIMFTVLHSACKFFNLVVGWYDFVHSHTCQVVHHNFHLFIAMKIRRANHQKSPSTCMLNLCCLRIFLSFTVLQVYYTGSIITRSSKSSSIITSWISSSATTYCFNNRLPNAHITLPPACSIHSRSSTLLGLWSSDRGIVLKNWGEW